MKKLVFLCYIVLQTFLLATESLSQESAFVDIQKRNYSITPHAAEIGRHGAVPVGLYTGTMKFDVPIFELENENLKIPVFLNYSSNGLLVDKLASWVGYDWNLNAGGIINRHVKGKPDTPGLRPTFPDNWTSMDNCERSNYLEYYMSHQNDLEPDIFSFSFLNYSGKFFFDENGKVNLIPYFPFKIEINTGSLYQKFKITTPDGIIYKFNDTDDTGLLNNVYYSNSWHLSKIIHPSGDSITFTYDKINLEQKIAIERSVTQKLDTKGEDPQGVCTYSDEKNQIKTVTNSISYIKFIEFHGIGKINFEILRDGTRKDSYWDSQLTKITLSDLAGNPIKSTQLFHQFRECEKQPNLHSNGSDKYRMFLDSIVFLSHDNKRIHSYIFFYNDIQNLPPRFSFSQDHKGYYNGKSNSDLISLKDVDSIYHYIFNPFIPASVDRSSNYIYSRKGMLSKIIYPTGGYTEIDYEPHKRSDESEIGGCRVLKIKNYTSSGINPDIKKYLYPSVATSHSLDPFYFYKYSTNFYYQTNMPPSNAAIYYRGECTYGVLTSNSLDNLYFEGNNYVCYPKVEVLFGENGENGREIYNYNITFDSPGTPINTPPGQIYPVPVSNTGWSSGNLIKTLTRSNILDKQLVDFRYQFEETRNGKEMNCLVVQQRCNDFFPNPCDNVPFYALVPYKLYSKWFYVFEKIETTYDNDTIIQISNYSYNNPLHAQLSEESTKNSLGQLVKTKYFYPHDYNNVDTTFKSKPIDIRTYRNASLTSGKQIKYNQSGQPTDIFHAEIDEGITDIAFNTGSPYTFTHKGSYSYNDAQKLKQVSPVYNVKTAYLWDATGTYLMARVENATHSQISVQDGKPCIYNSLTLYNTLKILVPDAMITTFTYKPLVGMTSQTDPNGLTTYYEYDTFGRLSLIRDHNDKILKKYDYHYAGQN